MLCATNDPPIAQKIRRHLGLTTNGLRCAPARGPLDPELNFHIDQDTEPWGHNLDLDDLDDLNADEGIDGGTTDWGTTGPALSQWHSLV